MKRAVLILALACAAATAACGGSNGPTGPTPQPPRISRTRFLAFGDSLTAGEVTSPISGPIPTLVHKQILVPAASYPSQLQAQLRITYPPQATAITILNSGEPGEGILDGALRFRGVFDANRPEVVLLQEGTNGLSDVGPDLSAGLMRRMVQAAKAGGARVFVGSMIPQVAGRLRARTPASETLAYNNTLQIMSTQEGVTFVDLYNPMLADAPTLIGSDGLHPTESGYRRIADLFFAAIRSELEEK